MKRYLAFVLCIGLSGLFGACSKVPPDRTHQDFSISVFHRTAAEAAQRPATPLQVRLFPDEGRAVDTEQSAISVRQSGVMTYRDGSLSGEGLPGTGTASGVRTFRQIPNGRYILWVIYNVRNMDYMASSLSLEVGDDLQGRMLVKVFTGMTPGYYAWSE